MKQELITHVPFYKRKKFLIPLLMSFFYIVLLVVLVWSLYTNTKRVRKFSPFEKSVLKPDIIEPHYQNLPYLMKDFDFTDNANQQNNFFRFQKMFEKYGIQFKEQKFKQNEKNGINYYGLLHSRKESNHRYFLQTFCWQNPYELIVMLAFVEEFFQRNQPLALNIIFLAYDCEFKNYNYSIKQFIDQIYQININKTEKILPEINFLREGLNIEIQKKNIKEPYILHQPYGFDGNVFDYEYQAAFAEKVDSSFIKTNLLMVSKPIKFIENFRKNWNKICHFVKLNFLKIGKGNLSLYSILKQELGSPHQAHQIMLEYGMDSHTLELNIPQQKESILESLSDFIKITTYAFRLANANQRSIESTFFVFSIVTKDKSVVRQKMLECNLTLCILLFGITGLLQFILRIKWQTNELIIAITRMLKIILQTNYAYNLPRYIFNKNTFIKNEDNFKKLIYCLLIGLIIIEILFFILQKILLRYFPIKNQLIFNFLRDFWILGYFSSISVFKGLLRPFYIMFQFTVHMIFYWNKGFIIKSISIPLTILQISFVIYIWIYKLEYGLPNIMRFIEDHLNEWYSNIWSMLCFVVLGYLLYFLENIIN